MNTTTLPAVAMTVVSMVLTLVVVWLWLGEVMPGPVALIVGLGIDGGWLATLAYDRRLAAQGDHSPVVTAIGWVFGIAATTVLLAHALTVPSGTAGWLAVAWLPLAAKALWLVHGLWERTALTDHALAEIRVIHQAARDEAGIARARLTAQASTEHTRLATVTATGTRLARTRSRTSTRLHTAWTALADTQARTGTDRALTCVTGPVTPPAGWELPTWEPAPPAEPALVLASVSATEHGDTALDRIVTSIRESGTPPLSYREMAAQFRTAGHSASEIRLRAAWHRTAQASHD